MCEHVADVSSHFKWMHFNCKFCDNVSFQHNSPPMSDDYGSEPK